MKLFSYLRLGFMGLTGAALMGCTTLGPDYQEPEPTWLAEWQPELYGQRGSAGEGSNADLSDWWFRFDDPALNTLIQQVLEQNLNLQVAGLSVLEARARLGGVEALRFPQSQQLGASAAYIRQRRSDGLLPASEDSFGSYDTGLSVGWELDFWGRFARGIESADAAFMASIANQRDLQVLLVAQTADIYYAYRTTQLRIEIARKNAAIQKRSFEITQQLFDSGQESELDLQQARTQYLATLATIPDLERSRVQLRNALAVLLARPPAPISELQAEVKALPAMEPLALTGIPAKLVLRRPDVRASAWQAGAQSAQIGVAKADLYPALSLFGSFGWSGDSLGVTRDGLTFAAGPAISWNIFDYGRIRSNVRVQDARLQQALAAFDGTVLQAAREIDDAAVAVIKTAEAGAVLSESRSAAERALELANRRYREGYADFQRVLDAQRSLFSQAEKELVNEGAHISAVIMLYKALGGGWQSQSLEDMIPPNVRETMRGRVNWGEQLEAEVPVVLDDAQTGESSQ
ncbi:efflux transporter outer membrane subunit [Congregibacter variabilis]|uniref:Efflux transporter outer membrane subunit n=1 Tax=Congregibacter variabilis TaxID=3081200 RepID=A0ABZ0I2S3_9GAMM|nr:efflux transporter outer membrane subunit [Congregibacter sp. IMCC43200]